MAKLGIIECNLLDASCVFQDAVIFPLGDRELKGHTMEFAMIAFEFKGF